MQALGPLRRTAEAIAACTQAPDALAAQSGLAAGTLAAQPHADIHLPHGVVRPLAEYYVTIAASGERKTGADEVAMAEVFRVEEEWRAAYEQEIGQYKHDLAAWKETAELAKRANRMSGRAAIRDGLAEIGPEPQEPPRPMVLVDDVTADGLVLHLASGRPWAGLYTSDGGLFVGGHAMSDDNRMRMGAMLNAAWDGKPIRRARVLTGFALLPGRRVSGHLMLQPAVAARLLGDALLEDMGLFARCLMVEPESTIGTRLFREQPPETEAHLAEHHNRIGHLLRLPPRLRADERALDPRPLSMSAQARRVWIEFHDAVERDLSDGGVLRPVRAFGAKLAEHAARLAGVMAMYADPEAGEVTGEEMACGVALAQHYAAEALRLQGAAAVSSDLVLADRLLNWWQARLDPKVHLAQIYQRGPNALGDAEKARRIVKILEEHGHVLRLPVGALVDGAARREAWALVP
jgi:hypothetical protein